LEYKNILNIVLSELSCNWMFTRVGKIEN